MMQRFATAAGVVILATALALLSAWWMLRRGPQQTAISNGPWRTSTVTGSVDADMYTRAQVAITGLFALSPSEAIYFSASVDDAGAPLRAGCAYAVVGKPLVADWWSITAYADDNFLIPNPLNRFSYNMGNLQPDADGKFSLVAGPTERPGNWLPTGSGTGFSLLLRLYHPAPASLASLRTLALPTIRRTGECL